MTRDTFKAKGAPVRDVRVVQRFAPVMVYDNPYSSECRPGMDAESWGEYVLYSDYEAAEQQLEYFRKNMSSSLAYAQGRLDANKEAELRTLAATSASASLPSPNDRKES